MGLQMNVLVPFALADDLGFLSNKISSWTYAQCDVRGVQLNAHLAEGIGKLGIHVLHNGSNLTLQGQLVTLLKVQPRRVNYRKKKSVIFGFAYLYASSVNVACGFGSAVEEVVNRDALLWRRIGRYFRRFKE